MGYISKTAAGLPELPPDCGKRLLPVVIDQLAQDEPERPWASFPVDDWDLSLGYEDINYRRLASAINKMAHFIVDHVGRSAPGKFETITYLGVSDARYTILQMAVVKTGHKVLFSSQLNTRDIHLNLMEQTQSKTLLSAVGVHVRDILEGKEKEIVHVLVPELDNLLAVDDIGPPFPYTKTYEEAAHDPILVLHSSGTTSHPKPIMLNHAAYAAMDRFAFLAQKQGPGGRGHALEWTHPGKGVRGLLFAPPFHGISAGALVRSVFGGGVYIPGFRHRPVGTQDVCAILEHSMATTAIMTPFMMEDVARRPDAAQFIKRLEAVYFAGATLSPQASKIWSQHCRIQNVWAATEVSGVPQLISESEEYEYSVFDLEAAGITFQDTGAVLFDADDQGRAVPLHDMVMSITPESAPYAFWAHREGLLSPDSRPLEGVRSPLEINMGDLWTPHPDPAKSSYVWRFAGRSDDLLTFSTGSNLHPGPILGALAESPLVRESIVSGGGRRQPLVVVELVEGAEDSEKTTQELWDTVVESMNNKLPTFGRIARTHMLLVPYGGFPRTAKGSASRKAVERMYAARIDDIYSRFGDEWRGDSGRYDSVIIETTISLSTSASKEAA
ncbi:unnamed protein product [Discula destructiva]